MSRYNQQYSEIKKMRAKEIIFFCELASAEDKHTETEMKKKQAEMKTRGYR